MKKDTDTKIFTPGSIGSGSLHMPEGSVRTGRERLPLWKPACPAHRNAMRIVRDLDIPGQF